MKNKQTLASLVILTALASSNLHAAKSIGYWYDTSGDIVRTGFGECWRTIEWSPGNAIAECEGNIPAKKPSIDSDHDGVLDSKDQCPSTTKNVIVDSKGCAKDSDKDGVIDSKDKCPGSKLGANVDNRGCIITSDSDGDGITDATDACPDSAAGTIVNKRGCKLTANISLENVQFKSGTAVLSGDSRVTLDKVANTLKDNNHLNFIIAGHTDSMGNYAKNVTLSKARAQSVRKYLIDKGVASGNLTASGFGPDKPVASNATRQGRSQNRRVELVLK